MAEQSKIDRIAPDNIDEQGQSKPTTVDLSIDVPYNDPDQPDAPTVMKPRVETFELREIPDVILMHMGAIAGGGGGSNENEKLAAIWRVLGRALAEHEMNRFINFAADTDAKVLVIMRWIGEIVAEISERPTTGQSSLPVGLPETPTGSTEPGDSEPETPAQQGSAL